MSETRVWKCYECECRWHMDEGEEELYDLGEPGPKCPECGCRLVAAETASVLEWMAEHPEPENPKGCHLLASRLRAALAEEGEEERG